MHPDASPPSLMLESDPFNEEQLQYAMDSVINGAPYVTTALWRSRAKRALQYDGDAADAIISFQIAAESLLFDTYRMLLVDERLSEAALADELAKDLPFKSLLVKVLPSRVGGQWDITKQGSVVAQYWEKVYLVRNAIVHAGFQPHLGQAEDAEAAYRGLREHLESRLWAKHRAYPRTVLMRLGAKGLQKNGWLTAWMVSFMKKVEAETRPYYLPFDTAGRERQA